MTILALPAIAVDGLGTSGRDDTVVDCDGVRMWARCRHLATVVTISGDLDASNGDRVQTFATRFVRAGGNALILDLGGVNFFSARGITVLIEVDDACRTVGVAWALVPSPVVSRVLQLTLCDTTLPAASSVSAALRQLAALAQARSQLALVTMAEQRHAV